MVYLAVILTVWKNRATVNIRFRITFLKERSRSTTNWVHHEFLNFVWRPRSGPKESSVDPAFCSSRTPDPNPSKAEPERRRGEPGSSIFIEEDLFGLIWFSDSVRRWKKKSEANHDQISKRHFKETLYFFDSNIIRKLAANEVVKSKWAYRPKHPK